MRAYNIRNIEDPGRRKRIENKFNAKVLPAAQLLSLKENAIRIGLIQQRDEPFFKKPSLILFASDHGYLPELPQQLPADATYHTVLNYLNGGAAANLFARQHGLTLKIADLGVSHRFERMLSFWLSQNVKLLNRKISPGTANFFNGPAMTTADCLKAIERGSELLKREKKTGCNFSGISQISAGSNLSIHVLLMAFTEKDKINISWHKHLSESELEISSKALRKHPKSHDSLTLLSLFGGFETAAMTGAILQAAEQNHCLILDGLSGLVAALAAQRIHPGCLQYCWFANATKGSVSEKLLEYLKIPVLNSYKWSAGEGSSIPQAYSFLHSACIYLKEASSLEDTDIQIPPKP